MSATPIPSKPCLRNRVLATSTIFSRFAAACSRVTFIDAILLLNKFFLDIIYDVRHEYLYMMTVMYNLLKESVTLNVSNSKGKRLLVTRLRRAPPLSPELPGVS